MRPRSLPAFLFVVLILSVCAFSSDDKAKPMSPQTKLDLVRAYTSELVYAHTTFPIGKKGLTLKDGRVSPEGKEMEQLLAMWGPAVKPGEQIMITNIRIKDNRIHFDINGGSIKKKKWYDHIQVGMNNNTMQTPEDPKVNPRGSSVELVFDKYIPEMTPEEFKAVLRPVFDFDAKSKLEAYLETVPPKVKDAIQNHDVLVGMNREMVTYSLGRPPKKIREKETDTDVDYEEWIYGEPPKDVHFVRLVGDEVVRVEVMKVNGEKVVRTEKEVDLGEATTVAKTSKDEPEVRPANAPSLRRPGEEPDNDPRKDDGVQIRVPVGMPGSNPTGPQQVPPPPPNFISLANITK
ncbi:MAG TPA: hypothetical protein VIW67_17170 [Terriglobales bacterium]|jgi:hypothetical protein